MRLDVHYEAPRKPPRVSAPADLSLANALQRAFNGDMTRVLDSDQSGRIVLSPTQVMRPTPYLRHTAAAVASHLPTIHHCIEPTVAKDCHPIGVHPVPALPHLEPVIHPSLDTSPPPHVPQKLQKAATQQALRRFQKMLECGTSLRLTAVLQRYVHLIRAEESRGRPP